MEGAVPTNVIDSSNLISLSSVWSIHYALQAPFSPRTFTVLIITHLEGVSPRQGWVISVPFDTSSDEAMMSMEERGIKGKYAAIERITELEDGSVEWRVATTTTVGGYVPDWFTARAVPAAIAEVSFSFGRRGWVLMR